MTIDNPADDYFTADLAQPQVKAQAQAQGEATALKPRGEVKSVRLYTMIRPSLDARIKAKATAENMSIANVVHYLLEKGLSQ